MTLAAHLVSYYSHNTKQEQLVAQRKLPARPSQASNAGLAPFAFLEMTTLSRPTSPMPVPRTQDLVLVHTSTSPIPSSKSSSGSHSGSHSSKALPASSSSSRTDINRSFDEWMTAYGANKLGLRPDQMPAPPPAILAILEEEKEMRSSSPASNASGDVMYLYSNCSAQSVNSAHSEEPLTALDRFRQLGYLQAPTAPFEEERLKLASKFGLEQPRRRAALDSICKIAKKHFSMKTVSFISPCSPRRSCC